MEQFDLFRDYGDGAGDPVSSIESAKEEPAACGGCESKPPEENKVHALDLPVQRLRRAAPRPEVMRPASVSPSRTISPWPAALSWTDALAYTSLSAQVLRQAERSGFLTFKRLGPRACKIVSRSQLDLLLERTFGVAPARVEEDFDFG